MLFVGEKTPSPSGSSVGIIVAVVVAVVVAVIVVVVVIVVFVRRRRRRLVKELTIYGWVILSVHCITTISYA